MLFKINYFKIEHHHTRKVEKKKKGKTSNKIDLVKKKMKTNLYFFIYLLIFDIKLIKIGLNSLYVTLKIELIYYHVE